MWSFLIFPLSAHPESRHLFVACCWINCNKNKLYPLRNDRPLYTHLVVSKHPKNRLVNLGHPQAMNIEIAFHNGSPFCKTSQFLREAMTIPRVCLRKWWYDTQKWILKPLEGDFPDWYPKPLGFSVRWPTPICTGLYPFFSQKLIFCTWKTCQTEVVVQVTLVHKLCSGGCEFEKGLLVRPMYLWAPFFPRYTHEIALPGSYLHGCRWPGSNVSNTSFKFSMSTTLLWGDMGD